MKEIGYGVWRVVAFSFQVLAVPYGEYMTWEDSSSVDLYLYFFLTVITLHALLAWLFLVHYFSSKHFKGVLVPMNEHFARHAEETARRERQIELSNWVKKRWRIGLGVSAVVWIAYLLWLFQHVYPTYPRQSLKVKIIFVLLPVTFPWRLMSPICLCAAFELVMQLHIKKMEEWEEAHEKPGSTIKDMVRKIKHNIASRRFTEKSWQCGFVIAFTWPLCTLACYTLLSKRNSEAAVKTWFFLVYLIHFLMQAMWIFYVAGAVSSASKKARVSITEKIATQEILFNEEPHVVSAYIHYLSQCYEGFSVLGVPISPGLGAKVLQLVLTLLPPVAMSLLNEVVTTMDIRVL